MHFFSGKTVVVAAVSTPAGSGFVAGPQVSAHLGRACALAFSARGARVWAIDTDAGALAALAREARRHGGWLETIEADPCDPQALAQAAELCSRDGTAVHALINCQAQAVVGTLETTSAQAWQRALEVNLLGPIHATQAFLGLLKRAGGAAVVHVGSVDGTLGNPQLPSYSVAKGGLVPLTHLMADEFAAHGIRVNCVARAMTADRGSGLPAAFVPLVAQTPMGRPGYPEEVASAVCFLASDEAAYVTGVVLPVDGGRTALTPGTRRSGPAPDQGPETPR